ncbi:uncharacterized protein LOC132932042 [Rhopalosiphum padi]|uniref:uncharacterized protein LOC132932042 n=1 Tax=Rhopalosiphum padi TaxID=40932 RepID=UPI00298ECA94|nr:uncharacterized protein LOC132932042 [Rhopalosiphum padi]
MNVVKILAIVVVTSVVTLLCIRSGQAMTKTPAGTVYNNTSEKPGSRDQGRLPSVSVISKTVAPKATDNPVSIGVYPVEEKRKEVQTTITVVTPEPNREEILENENQTTTTTTTTATITAEPLQLATSRSLNSGLNGENRITVLGPLVSGRKTSPIVVRGKLIRQIAHSSNHQASNGVTIVDDKDDDGDNEAKIIVDADVYHLNNRQLGNTDYSAIDTDISVAEEDGSAGYHDSYDAGYNKVNLNDGTGWNPGSYGGVVPTIGRPPYGMPSPYPYPGGQPVSPGYKHHVSYTNNVPPAYPYGHRPAGQYNMNNNFHQQVQMIYDKIDWHKVGIMALVKIGLAKLKAFGFLKILFLLVFKLKMFLIAMFFKFLLIAKLMKLFKLIMIPLILMTVLPLILSLFSAPMLVGGLLTIPARILDFLTGPIFAPAAATAATKVLTEPTSLPGLAIGKIGGSTPSYNKPDDVTISNNRRLEMFDPALTVFRKVLDSEKCVERIACRMAVVEKAGILPVWINWMLYRVSKMIPNEKLESYLRAYSEVNNVIYNKSDNPANWTTWCSERFDCNITNTTNTATNVIDAVQ